MTLSDESHKRCRRAALKTRSRLGPTTFRGITLVELLIVIAVVAILSAIALPAYDQFIIRANRAAAQRFMMDVANREEQFLANKRSYTSALDSTGLSISTPPELSTRYSFGIVTNDGCCGPSPNYQITATPIGKQSSDPALTLDSQGNKSPSAKW